MRKNGKKCFLIFNFGRPLKFDLEKDKITPGKNGGKWLCPPEKFSCYAPGVAPVASCGPMISYFELFTSINTTSNFITLQRKTRFPIFTSRNIFGIALLQQFEGWQTMRGTLIMSADIIYLYYDPLFQAHLTPMTSFLTTVHTKWPLNFNVRFQIFRALCASFKTFVNFMLKRRLFTRIWQNLHQMTPYFGKFTQKRPNFVESHTQWPLLFFYEILHRMPPVFVFR